MERSVLVRFQSWAPNVKDRFLIEPVFFYFGGEILITNIAKLDIIKSYKAIRTFIFIFETPTSLWLKNN